MRCTIFPVLVILIFLQGNFSHAAGKDDRAFLVWKGCSVTKLAFMQECAAVYTKKTGVVIKLVGGGATLGIRATVAGEADLGGSCRPPRPDIFPEYESGTVIFPVAWDAICFITHPDNPVDSISSEQARKVLTGEITSWKELGGPDQKILLIYRHQTEEGRFSGVGYMTRRLLFNDLDVNYTTRALHFRDSALVEKNVENFKWSIAPDGYSSAHKRQVKILAMDTIPCTQETIRSGEYPYYRPLYLVTRGSPEGKVKDFIDWIISPEGQSIISAQGTVSMNEGHLLADRFRYWEQAGLLAVPLPAKQPGDLP